MHAYFMKALCQAAKEYAVVQDAAHEITQIFLPEFIMPGPVDMCFSIWVPGKS